MSRKTEEVGVSHVADVVPVPEVWIDRRLSRTSSSLLALAKFGRKSGLGLLSLNLIPLRELAGLPGPFCCRSVAESSGIEYALRSECEDAGPVTMEAGDSEKPLSRPNPGRVAEAPPRDCCGIVDPELGAVRGGSPDLFVLACLGLEKFPRGATSCWYSGDSA